MRMDIQKRTTAKRPINKKRRIQIQNEWDQVRNFRGHDRGDKLELATFAPHILIIEEYCAYYGMKRYDLVKDSFRTSGREKLKNGVSLSSMRMALGYYFEAFLGLNLTTISKLIGYASHSTMSQNRKKIEWFLKVEDEKFFPYFKSLSDIADKYRDSLI